MERELDQAAGFVAMAQRKLDAAKEYVDLAMNNLGRAIENLNKAKGKGYKALNRFAPPDFSYRVGNEINSIGLAVRDIQEHLDSLKRFEPWAKGTDEELTEVHGGLLVAIPKGGA